MTDYVTIRGFVATKPDLRTLPNGTAVCSFRLASTARWFDGKTGDWTVGHTNWFTVNSFRSLGTNVAASVDVGQPLLVQGKLKIRNWETAHREKRTSVDIEARSVGLDLAFGTSTFVRAGGSRSRQGEITSGTSNKVRGSWGNLPESQDSAESAAQSPGRLTCGGIGGAEGERDNGATAQAASVERQLFVSS
ncbi:single-stranded DNA-binding protein [Kocuria sp. TGY1127_2]|uniref:single-stranded DNA-binding protein n=1 Tax=Kocuria sp. TGY1127_2 TaxID=2711328 RepID=UPI0015B95D27|nr:single-stranded DNA-binding protein [Kocuria sp. TGY1127_2]